MGCDISAISYWLEGITATGLGEIGYPFSSYKRTCTHNFNFKYISLTSTSWSSKWCLPLSFHDHIVYASLCCHVSYTNCCRTCKSKSKLLSNNFRLKHVVLKQSYRKLTKALGFSINWNKLPVDNSHMNIHFCTFLSDTFCSYPCMNAKAAWQSNDVRIDRCWSLEARPCPGWKGGTATTEEKREHVYHCITNVHNTCVGESCQCVPHIAMDTTWRTKRSSQWADGTNKEISRIS
jgi:hypothetical protein